jgi:hypothetical protein
MFFTCLEIAGAIAPKSFAMSAICSQHLLGIGIPQIGEDVSAASGYRNLLSHLTPPFGAQ